MKFITQFTKYLTKTGIFCAEILGFTIKRAIDSSIHFLERLQDKYDLSDSESEFSSYNASDINSRAKQLFANHQIKEVVDSRSPSFTKKYSMEASIELIRSERDDFTVDMQELFLACVALFLKTEPWHFTKMPFKFKFEAFVIEKISEQDGSITEELRMVSLTTSIIATPSSNFDVFSAIVEQMILFLEKYSHTEIIRLDILYFFDTESQITQ